MWLSDRRTFLLGAVAVALAGCGFAPAYGTGGAASKLQNAIHVEEPGDRNAYLVTRRIEERLGAGGPSAPYRLELAISVDQESLGSTADGNLNRYHVTGAATFAVRSAGTIIETGTVRNFTGYSASGSTVATLAAERDAEERLMQILADQIIDRLVLAAPTL